MEKDWGKRKLLSRNAHWILTTTNHSPSKFHSSISRYCPREFKSSFKLIYNTGTCLPSLKLIWICFLESTIDGHCCWLWQSWCIRANWKSFTRLWSKGSRTSTLVRDVGDSKTACCTVAYAQTYRRLVMTSIVCSVLHKYNIKQYDMRNHHPK